MRVDVLAQAATGSQNEDDYASLPNSPTGSFTSAFSHQTMQSSRASSRGGSPNHRPHSYDTVPFQTPGGQEVGSVDADCHLALQRKGRLRSLVDDTLLGVRERLAYIPMWDGTAGGRQVICHSNAFGFNDGCGRCLCRPRLLPVWCANSRIFASNMILDRFQSTLWLALFRFHQSMHKASACRPWVPA